MLESKAYHRINTFSITEDYLHIYIYLIRMAMSWTVSSNTLDYFHTLCLNPEFRWEERTPN